MQLQIQLYKTIITQKIFFKTNISQLIHFCIFIILPFLFIVILISPLSSVLYIFTFFSFNLSITSFFGCPNLLSFPTPINAIFGFTDYTNLSDDDVSEPWCATFKTVDFNLSKLYLYSLIISLSAISSMSPVNSIEKFL